MIIMKSGSFTVCHEVLDLVLLGFTEVSLGLYGFYWVLHVFFLVFIEFDCILPSLIGCYLV